MDIEIDRLEKDRKMMMKNWGGRHFTNMLEEMLSSKRFNTNGDNIYSTLSRSLISMSLIATRLEYDKTDMELKYLLVNVIKDLFYVADILGMNAEELFSIHRTLIWEDGQRKKEKKNARKRKSRR
jgi:hypothetical protein